MTNIWDWRLALIVVTLRYLLGVEKSNSLNTTSSMNNHPNTNIVVISNSFTFDDAYNESFFDKTSYDESFHGFMMRVLENPLMMTKQIMLPLLP